MIKKILFPTTLLTFLWLAAHTAFAQDGSNGPGIDNTARPAGTLLKFVPLGGRMVTFHRGYFYIMGQGKTTLWDVSDATDPQLLSSEDYGDNGHRWWKLNTDIFWREYTTPEIDGSGYHFMDMSDMFDLKPWTDPNVPVPIEEGGFVLQKWQFLETFPTNTNGGNVHDLRYDDPADNPDAITAFFETNTGAEGSLRFRIGNLMFATTGTGIAVLDIGDPENVKLLDAYIDTNFQQYTTTYHVWRDKIVFLSGTNGNLNGNNMAMIDFSDPTDLKPFVWPNGRTGLTTEEMSAGRYLYFQDEFGFTGSADLAVKINMETGEVVQEFHAPGWPQTYLDYQWMPLGPVVVGSGSNSGDGRTFFYQHQDGPDTRGPEVGFHSPAADSINNPISTVIGLSIPEVIDERTATDQTIQVRAVGSGEPIEGDITWNSYHVLNYVPKQFLEPNTTYEVRLIEGGLKDVAGNGVEEFIFYFSTGDELMIDSSPNVDVIQIVGAEQDSPVLVNTELSFTAIATDQEDTALEYRWDFGEGNSEWSNSADALHSFSETGIFSVSVQARDSQGGIGSSTRSVVVVDNLNATPPSKSGQMALAHTARKVLVVNPDNNTLARLDADTLALDAEWPTCEGPVSVALDDSERAWVSCRDSDEIAIHNIGSGLIESTVTLGYGAKPRGILANADGTEMFVALSGKGAVAKFSTASLAKLASTELAPFARALAMDTDGNNLLVSQFISGSAGRVWQLNTADLSLLNEFTLENDTTTPDAGNMGGGLPNYLAGISFTADGSRAFVVGKKDNTDRGQFFGTEPLSFEFTARSNISELDIVAGTENTAKRIDIDNHAQPSSITFNQYGSHAFITMQGNNQLIVINPETGAEIARSDTGLAPQDVLFDPTTQHVFVKNFMSRDVSVFDASALVLGEQNNLDLLDTIATVTAEKLSAEVLAGKQLFYNSADTRMTAEGYLSCATCHDGAGQDGRVWDFTARGEGLRNTISLVGRAGTGHGRVHWSANFDEIQDFEHDIRNAFAGSGFLSDDDFEKTNQPLGESKAGLSPELDALAAYQATLTSFGRSPYRNADGSLSAEAIEGKAIFEQARCASCHTGAAFTDSPAGLTHDVGTIDVASGQRLGQALLGIDTPTLRGVWNTAPYLHDGSQATLEDVLLNGGAAHNMQSLSSEEQSALAAYLKQIDDAEPAATTADIAVEINSVSAGDEIREESIPLSVDLNLTDVSLVEYFANGVLVASAPAAPFSATWVPEASGEYRLVAKAYYNEGATASVSPEIKLQVGPSGKCTVQYMVMDDWGSGYRVDLTAINDGEEDISGVELIWSVGDNEFASGWNASYVNDGGVITASIAAGSWNGNLAALGGSVSMGFQFNKVYGTLPALPEEIRLNGATCVLEF